MSGGLSREQQRQFDERGLVRLERLVPRSVAETMADRLWQEMSRKDGIRCDDPVTWRAERPAQFGAFQKTGAFEAMATPELRGLLDQLIGAGRWAEPRAWGQPLVCFPFGANRWELPHQVWHLDLTPDPRRPDMKVGRLFVLLAPLRARGGGTLVATGSHRVVADLAGRERHHLTSQEMRRRLVGAHPWFTDLMSPPRGGEDRVARFMGSSTVVNGVDLRVEEITGDPGDVILMHQHALHGPSSNVLDTPRLALAQTIYPKAWFGA